MSDANRRLSVVQREGGYILFTHTHTFTGYSSHAKHTKSLSHTPVIPCGEDSVRKYQLLYRSPPP